MDKERIRQLLPEEPPKGLLEWTKRHCDGELGPAYLTWKSVTVPVYNMDYLMGCDSKPYRRERVAECTCLKCGSKFVTEKIGNTLIFWVDECGEWWPLDPNGTLGDNTMNPLEAEDNDAGYRVDVDGDNEAMQCPMCYETVRTIPAKNLRGGRRKQILVNSIQTVEQYAVVVYWLVCRTIYEEGHEYQVFPRDANQSVLNMQQQLAAAKSDEGAWQEQIDRLTNERDTAETNEENLRKEIDKLTAEKHLAETSEKNATKKVEVLENQLKEARKKEKTAREELKKAQENPDIPESVMEQLRREAEADALSKSAGDLQKQLESANAALAAEQERSRAIEEKLDAAQRKNDPEMVECNVVAQKLRADFNSLLGWVKKISVGDREKGEKMLKFIRLLVKAWAEALGMEVEM